VVVFLYRDIVYDENSPKRNVAEILLSKHRHGPTGKVELVFIPHETRFADLSTAPDEIEDVPT